MTAPRVVFPNSLEFVGRPTVYLPRGGFGYTTRGRVVISVKRGSKAEKFGVRVGWLENKLNGHKNMPESHRRKLRERPSKRGGNEKTVKVDFLIAKKCEYRVLWQALASDHQNVRHPSRKILGSVKAGAVVEVLDFSSDGSRVFVKRPRQGWAMHSRGWIPGEVFAWMSTRSRDGQMLMKKIEAPKKEISLDFSDSRSRRGTAHSRVPSHASTTHNRGFFGQSTPQYPFVSHSARPPQTNVVSHAHSGYPFQTHSARLHKTNFVSHATPGYPDLDAPAVSAYPNPRVTLEEPTAGGDFEPSASASPPIQLKLYRKGLPVKKNPIGLSLDFKEDPKAHTLTNHPIPTRRRLHHRARSESFVLRMAKKSMVEERLPLNIKLTPRLPKIRQTAFDLDFNEGKQDSPSSEQKTFEMPAPLLANKAFLGLPPKARPPKPRNSRTLSRSSVGEQISWIIPPDSTILRSGGSEPSSQSTKSKLSISKGGTVNIAECELDPYAPADLEYTPSPPVEGFEDHEPPPNRALSRDIDHLRVQVELRGKGSHTPLPERQDTPTPPSRTQGTVQKSGEISDAEEGDFNRVPVTILESPRGFQKSDEGRNRIALTRMLAYGRASPMSETVTGERAPDTDVEMTGEPNTATRGTTPSSRSAMPAPPPEISRTIRNSVTCQEDFEELEEYALAKKARTHKLKRKMKVEREDYFGKTLRTANV